VAVVRVAVFRWQLSGGSFPGGSCQWRIYGMAGMPPAMEATLTEAQKLLGKN